MHASAVRWQASIMSTTLGLGGIFFPTALDMSPTLDAGDLSDIRAKADELGLYLESGLGKINPYCSAEAPELGRPATATSSRASRG